MFRNAILSVALLAALPVHAQTSGGRKIFNPDIGINFLGYYARSSNEPSNLPNGFRFQEAELQFTADVDPYVHAVTLFSVHPPDNTAATNFEIEPEEVYVESLSLPRVTLKVGKFRTAFGKHNPMHTHAFPFVDAPLTQTRLLGADGLDDLGVSGAVLLPTPFFSEFTTQVISGGNNDTLFGGPDRKTVAGVVHLRNLWDLTDDATFEFGLSGAKGKNAFDGVTNAYGSHLTAKWRPAWLGKYRSVSLTAEYLGAHRGLNTAGEDLGGIGSWLMYQFAERWYFQTRFDYVGLPRLPDNSRSLRETALLGFYPSEFSAYRLQYDHTKTDNRVHEHRVAVQWNISIGAHPAHGY